ncbi:MAG: TonB-dependent receptor [Melioribacteraceae bacterium]|nr:TonB-dependent receptor [Melioribacteraceae bacterium]
MKKLNFLFIVYFILISAFISFAQETKEAQKTNEGVVSTQDLSRATNAEDMAEALKTIPGVYIRSGQINIRDAVANKVLILIDGQRMNSAQSGGFDVTSLPIDAIEKVEVLRGGNSARYGADAVGGVVNFITKKAAEESKMNVGLRGTYGSFNSQFYNVFTSNTLDKFNYYLSYKRAQSDGNFTFKHIDGKEEERKNNDSKSNDFLAKLGYDLMPDANLTFTTQYSQSENGSPGSVAGLKNWASAALRARLRLDNMIFNLNYGMKNIFGKADFTANTYYHSFRTRFDDPDTWGGPTSSDHKNYAYGVELAQNNPVSDIINLTYGYIYRHDEATSSSIGEKNRNTHSAHASMNIGFKNADFYFGNISLIPAVRYDAPSDFDKIFSPKVSLILSSTDQYALNFSAHLSKSYRAPTFNDLYWPEDAFTVGNPNLKPEKGTSFEFGYGITLPFLNKTQIKMNYFTNEISDQIIWAPRADFKWTPTNVEKSKTSGLETYIGTKFFEDLVGLEFNHTYMDARDASGKVNDGKLLIYRPYHKLDINTSLRINIVEFNINYQFLSERFVDVANTAALPDLNLWNMNIGANPELAGLKWNFRIDLNNIFNKDYRLSDGYPMPGREIRATVGLSLQ